MPIFYLSGESPPSTFPLWINELFIFLFFVHVTKSKLIARPVPVLMLPEKNALFHLVRIWLSVKLLGNQVSAENIGIEISALIRPS